MSGKRENVDGRQIFQGLFGKIFREGVRNVLRRNVWGMSGVIFYGEMPCRWECLVGKMFRSLFPVKFSGWLKSNSGSPCMQVSTSSAGS